MLQNKNSEDQREGFNLEEIAPELAKMNKSNPFLVPGNYFEKLPVEILNKTRRSKRFSFPEVIQSLFLKRKFNLAVAFTGLIVIIAIIIFNKSEDISVNNQFFSNITLDDVLLESPEIIEYMDESLIVETLFAGSDQVIDFNSSNEFENDSSISEDDLINYLSDEEIATELIYEL